MRGDPAGAEVQVRMYADARKEIRNGDVLLYRGKSRLSRFIRWVTRSRYSHAAVALWWEGRLVVVEAVGSGVVASLLSRNVRHYDGGVEWYQCTEPIDTATREKMVRFSQDNLGKTYALLKALVVMASLMLRWRMDKNDRMRKSSSLFCSHLVAEIYNQADLDLKKGKPDWFTTPRDISESPLLKKIAVLKHEDGQEPWRPKLKEGAGIPGALPAS